MPLPHNALVLVADGRKMLFFRNHGDENQIDLRTEAHEERKDRKDREIKSDAPGTTKQSGGYGRSTYEEPERVVELYQRDPQLMSGLQSRVMEDQVADWIADHAKVNEQHLSFGEAMRPA